MFCYKKRNYEKEFINEYRKGFMKPDKNEEDIRLINKPCKMNTKDKNLWITGTKEQCENFLKLALGKNEYDDYNCYRPEYVYDKDDTGYWDGYDDQPFIVFRNYNKQKRTTKIREMRAAGGYTKRTINIRWSSGTLNPDLYHCIILSTFTPEEYCKGMVREIDEIEGLKRRFDTLQLK